MKEASSEASAGVDSAPERMKKEKQAREIMVRVLIQRRRRGCLIYCPTHAVGATQRQQTVPDAAHVGAA